MPTGPSVDLTTPVTDLAICVQIVRPDGVQIGLTSHDRSLRIGGLLHQSSPGLALSAIRRARVGHPQQFEMSGALSTGAVNEEDIRAGRYRGATARAAMADWTNPALTPFTMATGYLQLFRFSSDRFSCEVVSSLSRLASTLLPVYSPYCRAQFGDAQCRVATAARRRREVVISVDRAQLALTLARQWPSDWASVGRVRIVSGKSCGTVLQIRAADGQRIIVDELPGDYQVMGEVLIESGCDHQFSTCRDVYGNRLNFRGEPNIPGTDAVASYEY